MELSRRISHGSLVSHLSGVTHNVLVEHNFLVNYKFLVVTVKFSGTKYRFLTLTRFLSFPKIRTFARLFRVKLRFLLKSVKDAASNQSKPKPKMIQSDSEIHYANSHQLITSQVYFWTTIHFPNASYVIQLDMLFAVASCNCTFFHSSSVRQKKSVCVSTARDVQRNKNK